MKALFVLLVLLVAASVAQNLNVSNTFGSNMVLQRAPYSAFIYGWATAGDTVTLAFNGEAYKVQANAMAFWKVKLPPTVAGGPYVISVTSAMSLKNVLLENILFGDVWICSGQSNMQFTVHQAFNATLAIAQANNYPDIRIMTVGEEFYSPSPLNELHTIAQRWSVASNKTVGVGDWSEFSAACWFTGIKIYDKYKVPLGLISTNWGGTVIQAWSSPVALKECNVTKSGSGYEANSVLYNAMIYPFLQQTVLGALWYQGESNQDQSDLYVCMFQAMIKDWRANFPYGELTFLFVQLAPYSSNSNVQGLRQAQWDALVLPKVGGATAADLGDISSPFGNIHPRDKATIGVRLALAASALAYGEKDVSYRGPEFASVTHSITGATLKATVVFNLFLSTGLVWKTDTCPKEVVNICQNWVVTLSNGKDYPAVETAVGPANTVQIEFTGVPAGATVKAFSYGFSQWPSLTVFNKEGLPAIPFQYMVPPKSHHTSLITAN